MAGAAALFIPTTNALPPSRDVPAPVTAARALDVRLATEFAGSIVLSDVVGEMRELVSRGSSAIVDRSGSVPRVLPTGCPDLPLADIAVAASGERADVALGAPS
jgi:hypothetical protein